MTTVTRPFRGVNADQRVLERRRRLIAAGLDMYLAFHDAPLATVEQLSRAHPREHVEEILASVPEHGIRHLDPDTAMSPGTMKAGSTPRSKR